jgi:transmembrane sensor
MEQDRQDPAIEDALRWLVVLRDDEATSADRQAFAAWLSASPAHATAWERAQEAWSRADMVGPTIMAERHGIAPPPVAFPGAMKVPTRRASLRLGRREWMGGAAAAGVVAMVGGYALTRPGAFADYRTGTGERRTMTLADGSTVELGSATSLSVGFDERHRLLRLHEGEAFFSVAPDVDRPFIVAAANGQMEALGTAFNVKHLRDAVSVSIVEHAVAVSVNGGRATRLAQGQTVRYGPGGVETPAKADLGAALSWRRDRLVFHDAPLGEVVADLERYRRGRVIITDARIGALPVTAVIDVRQTDAALQTIADTLQVRVRRLTDLLVLISPAA